MQFFGTGLAPPKPKRSILAAGARRRCFREIPGYFHNSHGVFAALFNALIAARRLYGTSLYFERFGRLPDYAHPRGYSEKVQWRKLFDRNPAIASFCDKIAARELALQRAPGIRFAEILWCGKDPEALPLDTLQPPFVVKPSNRSGASLLIRCTADVSQKKIRNACRKWVVSPPYGAGLYEWGYRRTTGRIVVERFLSRPGKLDPPPDFKFYVFSGKTQWVFYSNSYEEQRGLYSPMWEPLPLDRWNKARRDVLSMAIPAPAALDKMVGMAEAIAAGFDHARVDLYAVGGEVFFGELTAYPYGGFATWLRKTAGCDPYPERDVDDELGSHWTLPKVSWPKRLRRGLFG